MSISKFADFTKKFPGQMEKVGIRVNEVLANSYTRRIKSRANGRLKKIKAVPKGKLLIQIQYPNEETAKIAGIVNAGKPHKTKFIPKQLMDASRAGKETAGKKAEDVLGHLANPIWVPTSSLTSTSKGFLTKSGETLRKNTPSLIEKELQAVFNAS